MDYRVPDGYTFDAKIEVDSPIFVFWYQGIEKAPAIVKAAVKSIKENGGARQVVILDKDNLRQYVDFPDYIWRKVENGTITLTHFSDLVRMNLLSSADRGGYWMDATICLSKKLPDYDTPFYSIRNNSYNPRHVNGGKDWSAFFIGVGPRNAACKMVHDFFLRYWESENHMIDYFLVDYGIYLLYEHFPEFKSVISNNPIDNPNVSDMANALDSDFSIELWNHLLESQTIHKLSYKLPYRKGNTIGEHIAKMGLMDEG